METHPPRLTAADVATGEMSTDRTARAGATNTVIPVLLGLLLIRVSCKMDIPAFIARGRSIPSHEMAERIDYWLSRLLTNVANILSSDTMVLDKPLPPSWRNTWNMSAVDERYT